MAEHADTIRRALTKDVAPALGDVDAALAAVDVWEAEDAQMQGYDHLQMVEVSELRAEVRRLRDALEQIAAHPHGGILVNIACAALAEEADRG